MICDLCNVTTPIVDALERYTLEGRVPVRSSNIVEWGKWMVSANRTVATIERDGVTILTSFLGFSHGPSPSGPLLFETMIRGGERDGYRMQCATWEQAEALHQYASAMAWPLAGGLAG